MGLSLAQNLHGGAGTIGPTALARIPMCCITPQTRSFFGIVNLTPDLG